MHRRAGEGAREVLAAVHVADALVDGLCTSGPGPGTELGLDLTFLEQAGVLRGLHIQAPPKAQDKLVRCVAGAILDVAVDIRRGSPTFGKWVSAEISADNWRQIFVPRGFAHGFVTLKPNTEVCYKVSDYYSREHERGIRFDDPALAIDWRIDRAKAVLSDRDRDHPPLAELESLFEYGKVY